MDRWVQAEVYDCSCCRSETAAHTHTLLFRVAASAVIERKSHHTLCMLAHRITDQIRTRHGAQRASAEAQLNGFGVDGAYMCVLHVVVLQDCTILSLPFLAHHWL